MYKYSRIIEIISILLIGIISIFLLDKNPLVFDLTKEKKYSISKELINFLNSLDSPVYIKVLYDKGSKEYNDLMDFLIKLGRYSKKIKYEYLDPRVDFAKANLYGFSSNNQVLIIYKNRKKYENSNIDQDKFYNIVFNLANQKKGNIAFITGHGEYSIDNTNPDGLSSLKQSLSEEGFSIKTINLATENLYVNENLLSVIVSPKIDITDFELKKINDYLYNGGRLIFALSFKEYLPSKFPNLNKLVNLYGILVSDKVAISVFTNNPLYVIVFPVNLPYLSNLYNTNLTMFAPLIIERNQSNKDSNIEATSLSEVLTTKAVVANVEQLKKGVLQISKDIKEYTVCMMSEKVLKNKKSMLLVLGDSNILANSLLNASDNKSFIMNVIDYMLDQPIAKSLRPNDVPPLPVVIKKEHMIIMYIIYLSLPFIFIILVYSFVIKRRFHARFKESKSN
ncbi:MAG: Gldg family protein [bacterium]